MVDDIDSIPPRKMQSIFPHPRRLPTPVPISIIALITVRAITNALPPTFAIFLKLNSSPRPNIRNTTPIFAHTWMSSISTTVGRYTKFGLIKKPATIYPSTTGCLSFLKSIVTMAAAMSISARSDTR